MVTLIRTARYNSLNMNYSSPATRRGRPITRNREHVLETAMYAYWKEDWANVSVNAICELAGVSKPSLYRDFGCEDELTAAVLDRYAQTILGPMELLLSSNESFSSKLEALIYFISEDSQMEMGCLFVKMRTTRSRFGKQTQEKINAIEAHFIKLYIELFKKSAKRGEWAGKVTAELAATYLYEQMGLAVTQRAAGKKSELVRQLLGLALSVVH